MGIKTTPIPLKKSILIGVLAILVVCISLVGLSSSLNYKLMSSTEKLKNQLYREYNEYTNTLIQDVEVMRPWYSLSPENWTYVVTFSENYGQHTYMYQDGKFCESTSDDLLDTQ